MQPPATPARTKVNGRSLEELVTTMTAETKCKGRTKAKKRCRNKAIGDSERCGLHQKRAKVLQLVPPPTSPTSNESKEHEPGPNERALVRTLSAMGHESDLDAARFQMLRSLAVAVDLSPTTASLWKEYREAIADLMKDADDANDSLKRALDALKEATEGASS